DGLRAQARGQLTRCRIRAPGERYPQALLDWLSDLTGRETNLANLLNFDRLAQDHHFVSSESARSWLSSPGQADRIRADLTESLPAALAGRGREALQEREVSGGR